MPDFVSGDVTIAAIIDGETSITIPKKEDGYVFESVTCTNGAEAEWNSDTWKITIGSLSKSKTTCTVSFKTASKIPPTGNFRDYITKLVDSSDDLAYDETVDNNLRYIGANPNNYVKFNDELWRIIGVMNNIKDSNGNTGSHIKIIKNESIGDYYWSGSSSNTSNDWTQSTLNTETLNGTYYNGLISEAKNMIANVVWSLGGISSSNTTSTFYTAERGTTVYNGRPTKWTGRIGLMYPSDYGYATSGGSTTNRTTCLNTELFNWASSNVSDCKNTDWLLSSSTQWTLMPDASNAYFAFYVGSAGNVDRGNGYNSTRASRPVLYLDSKVEITSGEGTQNNPYQLKLGS